MYVAKSYQGLEQIGKPYEKNGKEYIAVILKSGKEKEVRVYSEREYRKMYGASTEPQSESTQSLEAEETSGGAGMSWAEFEQRWSKISPRQTLGFGEAGYITLFKGDQDNHTAYFSSKRARYCKYWGWYIHSDTEVFSDLPFFS